MSLDPGPLSRLSRSLDPRELLAELIRIRELVPEAALEDCLQAARASGGPSALKDLLTARGLLSRDALEILERELATAETAETAEAASAPAVPRRIGRYEVRDRLGEGGAGVVFRARDETLGRDVALKILKTAYASSSAGVERFEREGRNAARLHHPNIVTVYDAGREGEVLYYAMELVSGRPLDTAAGPLPDRVRTLEKVARAVQYAHEQGIIHRDLKPLNILRDEQGEPRLLDFGLSREVEATEGLTRSGSPLGTPLYMAPEQVRGKTGEISERTDVYALGAILYEMLAGRPPHGGGHVSEIYGRILADDPVPPRTLDPKLPRDLETIVLKALQKEPSRRYASAGEFADDLRRHLSGEAILARPEGRFVRWARRVRRRPAVYASAAALLVVVAVGISRGEKGRAFEAEREKALQAFRETARVSLDAALRLRRAGDSRGMKVFLPPLEAAYRDALERAPAMAEVEYYMGRMHRALMRDDRALEFQERALKKDPAFAPALYERVVLQSKRYASLLNQVLEDRDPAPDAPLPAELVRLGERILADSRTLERRLEESAPGGGPSGMSSAHVRAARGIFAAYADGDDQAALGLLRSAVEENPLLEEAWESMAHVAMMQAGHVGEDDRRVALYDVAERACTEGIRLDRGYLPHHIGRGHVRTERARWLQNKGRDYGPDFQGAFDDLSRAIELEPAYAEAWMRRGRLQGHRAVQLRTRGDPMPEFARAEGDLDEAIRLEPAYAEAWMRRGRIRHQRTGHLMAKGGDATGGFEAAEADFSRAIELGLPGGAAWSDRGQARLRLGELHAAAGRKEAARRALEGALSDFDQATARASSEARKLRLLVEEARRRLSALGGP